MSLTKNNESLIIESLINNDASKVAICLKIFNKEDIISTIFNYIKLQNIWNSNINPTYFFKNIKLVDPNYNLDPFNTYTNKNTTSQLLWLYDVIYSLGKY